MLRLRLNLVKLILQLVVVLLPACAFAIAGYLRWGAGNVLKLPVYFDLRAYMVLLILTTVAWAFVSNHFGLSRPQRIFAAGGKTKKSTQKVMLSTFLNMSRLSRPMFVYVFVCVCMCLYVFVCV